MPYNRKDAMNYATTYWHIPCKDGLLGTRNERMHMDALRKHLHAPAAEWEALFVRDSDGEKGVFRKAGQPDITFHKNDGLDDCAHFVSQCVIAGGGEIKTQWGPRELKEDVQSLPATHAKTLAERVPLALGQRIVDSGVLREGDLIIYFNNNPPKGSPHYTHSAMYVGNQGITCHSDCRFKGKPDSGDDEWHLSNPDFTFTMLHYCADDAAPDPGTLRTLLGWWKVEYPGKAPRFSFFSRAGWARSISAAPRGLGDPAPTNPPSYWFFVNNSITVMWKDPADVEVWTLGNGGTVATTMSGTSQGKATKL